MLTTRFWRAPRPGDRRHGFSGAISNSIEKLNEQSAKLAAYTAERKAAAARADARERAEDAERRERMVEVAKAVPTIITQDDKRRVTMTPRGKKVKTRTKRTAQKLRLTRTKK
ncbi:MAG: hypothetical protein KGI70_00230 [Patescibacteria group bacterium]|nr:hypothetical protein [Patescibacteria group bacterium]